MRAFDPHRMRQTVLEWLACVPAVCIVSVAWATEADTGRIETQQARASKPAGASASGVIREIDRANSRIKIDHGPIPSIGMCDR